MIDRTDERLREWAAEVLEGENAILGPPDDSASEPGVSLYLLELVDSPPARSSLRPPLQLALRYVVTTWAADPAEAHRLLSKLAFDAMERPEFDVELEPLSPAVWSALGTIPRPSFILRVLIQQDRPLEPAKPVLKPLVVQASTRHSVKGVVLGPDDTPLTGARVELPALELSTSTDSQGRFSFAFVPAEPEVTRLIVKAKGRTVEIDHKKSLSEDPVVIRFELTEV